MAKHGTRGGYQRGCRCEGCAAANRDYRRRHSAGLIPERIPAVPVVKVFSDIRAAGQRIGVGEKRVRKVSEIGGTPCLGGVPVSLIGAEAGDTVEVEYQVDCIIIRKLPSPT